MSDPKARLRRLPSVDQVKKMPFVEGCRAVPDHLLTIAIRNGLDSLRNRLLDTDGESLPTRGGKLTQELVAATVEAALENLLAPSLVPLFNATGVVVHTNLGRAPIGPAIWRHMEAVATGYSNLEYDLDEGGRGSRHQHFQQVITRLTGAEDCVVVNNNAAAVLLVLTALARGREVVISRSELIEIGGSFRLPDIMAQGGAILREVGTSNRTWRADYEGALCDRTGLVMKAHRSNFTVEGFVHEVSRAELAELAVAAGIPFYEDLGSGLMTDLSALGIAAANQVAQVVRDGVPLISFSGDKMLGGPQAGVIVGRRELIARLKSHPLTRALRPDKLTLAGLEAVALAFLRGDAEQEIPVVRMLTESAETVQARAEALAQALDAPGRNLAVVPSVARVGGGAEPQRTVPSFAVRVAVAGLTETALERALRSATPPIIARIEEGHVLLDARTLLPGTLPALARAFEKALNSAA